jgi:hypothetical protein
MRYREERDRIVEERSNDPLEYRLLEPLHDLLRSTVHVALHRK